MTRFSSTAAKYRMITSPCLHIEWSYNLTSLTDASRSSAAHFRMDSTAIFWPRLALLVQARPQVLHLVLVIQVERVSRKTAAHTIKAGTHAFPQSSLPEKPGSLLAVVQQCGQKNGALVDVACDPTPCS